MISQLKNLAIPTIAFIGGGNMAEAILGGLVAAGHPVDRLRYSEPFDARRQYMQSKYPEVKAETSNTAAVEGADVIVLAVKPQVLRNVVQDLAPVFQQTEALVLSIVAGIKTSDILRWMNASHPVALVRSMPNTPALIGEGAVGLFATNVVSEKQRETTETIMNSIAKKIIWVEKEGLVDSVTGMSGSGPAYFFLMMEAMQDAGVAAGLTPEEAKDLTLQTCLGAARMALESEDDLPTLRSKVTSPNGTTEAAIKSMEKSNIRKLMLDAVMAATARSQELAEQLGKD
ncbi:hypothetical protein EC973_002245 [Apophysomyces ossiformis]|uniref:Pyrroline-5-carboxylate reductase n=1 Tax=Apophysomyces ossiformis TaxID=679940 RepID=A0A8H7ESJ8_9FUNG|nr:hypothetical protein EC973_002245 [Apophysomyces ossiformis]